MHAPGRGVAAIAGGAQVLAAFLAWTDGGLVGLDVRSGEVAIGVQLVVLASLPLLALLVNDRGWPRVVSGTLTALLVLAHLADGPDGHATSGVLLATAAAIGHWLAAALASGRPIEVARLTPRSG